ncbi:uncharacterized protein LOC111621533 isoform X2 [Centruroides sculpturatus]|uniref:uncharacterized protein LOC111621533 isoform X2 n=1 Tax=Centruroides sculpturatus TaxID=218467 RepID=UPI000C6D1B20|nr:uncharacterized protein LOC111621533 isoform X2 [Centruroides sculpturatus]
MEAGHYTGEGKLPPSTYYNSLSGSACFPLPLLYNQMNSYPFFSGPFLPLHPCVLPQHGLQDSAALTTPRNVLASRDLMKNAEMAMTPVTFDYVQARHRSYKEKHQNDVQRLNIRQANLASMLGMQNNNCVPDVKKVEAEGSNEVYQTEQKPCDITPRVQNEGKITEVGQTTENVNKSWTTGQTDSSTCPLCGVVVAPLEWQAHFRQELEEFTKNTMWMCQKESMVDLFNPTTASLEHLRMHTLTEAGKRTVEARRETYLRVRANRLHRLGGRSCRPRKASLSETSVIKPRLPNDMKGQDEAIRTETNGSGEVMMLGLTVQKSDNQEQDSNKDFSSEVDISNRDASNEKNNEENLETPHLMSPMNGRCSDTEEKRKNGSNIQCVVCLESYRKPVVSVCCWHVHCERCWLKSLGTKRLCPQCDAITSPSDLRRIHL